MFAWDRGCSAPLPGLSECRTGLGHRETESEKPRPETDATHVSISPASSLNRLQETGPDRPNPRKCRHFCHTRKSRHRDQSGWLRASDSNIRTNLLLSGVDSNLRINPIVPKAEVRPASAPSRDFLAKTGQLLEKYPSLVSSHAEKGRLWRTLWGCLTIRDYPRRWLAGAPGFEPGNGGIKILCLTTWLRPNRRRNIRGGGWRAKR
jgi:hypothetical protein